MLSGKDLRGCHDRRLRAVFHRKKCRIRRADRLTGANVTDHEAIHENLSRHIRLDLAKRSLLRAREFIRKSRKKRLFPRQMIRHRRTLLLLRTKKRHGKSEEIERIEGKPSHRRFHLRL